MWEVSLAYLEENAKRTVAVSELFDRWRKPPFGLSRMGSCRFLPLRLCCHTATNWWSIGDGIFRARFDDVDVEYLAKNPDIIQLRWMDLSEGSRNLLSGMAQVVRDLDSANTLVHLEPIDVGRGLVAIYDQLPQWTTRTMRLSTNAMRVRDIFKRAHDPNAFLFEDIPGTLGEDVVLADNRDVHRVMAKVSETGWRSWFVPILKCSTACAIPCFRNCRFRMSHRNR